VSGLSKLVRCMTLTVVIAGSGVILAGPAQAAGSAENAGALTFVTLDHSTVIRSGSATTEFTLGLPAHAACPQDSTQGDAVVSFLESAGTDWSALTFRDGIPAFGWTLDYASGTPMYPVLVAKGTAEIPVLEEDLTWDGYLHGNLPLHGSGGLLDADVPRLGVWDAGLACIYEGRMLRYWSTEVTFVPSGPSSFTWKVSAPGSGRVSSTRSSSSAPLVAGVGLALVAAGGAALVVRRRRGETDVGHRGFTKR
jgi:hypothetical protein